MKNKNQKDNKEIIIEELEEYRCKLKRRVFGTLDEKLDRISTLNREIATKLLSKLNTLDRDMVEQIIIEMLTFIDADWQSGENRESVYEAIDQICSLTKKEEK